MEFSLGSEWRSASDVVSIVVVKQQTWLAMVVAPGDTLDAQVPVEMGLAFGLARWLCKTVEADAIELVFLDGLLAC